MFVRIVLLLFLSLVCPRPVLAETPQTEAEDDEEADSEEEDERETENSDEQEPSGENTQSKIKYDIDGDSPYHLSKDQGRPRSTFWAPFFSFIIPGLDQLMEGQETYGLSYLGTAVLGSGYSAYILKQYQKTVEKPEDLERDAFEANPNVYEKKIRLGEQIFMASGSLSAYHAYRSAVGTYSDGRYDFLGKAETPSEILLAPFRFDYLARTSTLAPVLIAAGIHLIAMNSVNGSESWSDYEKVPLDGDGAFYTGAYSYMAGTNEEALFRGWLLPEMYVAFGSELWAKVANAVLFGAAHLGNISTPLPQLIFGYYLSDLTIQNKWKISEAVFIHTWWNVFAFLTVHQIRKKEDAQAVLPPIVVPFLNQRF